MKPGTRQRTLPDISGALDVIDWSQILDGQPLEDGRVNAADASGRTLQQFVARRSLIESCSFAQTHLRAARWRDVRFLRCDFSNAVIRGLEATRVEFIDCRLIGVVAIECQMQDVLMERCDSSYAQFNDGSARVSDFLETKFQEADFRATNLENTRWVQSDLSRADLTGARLGGADLRGAIIDGVIIGSTDLSGAIVSPAQAMELARLLGVVIR